MIFMLFLYKKVFLFFFLPAYWRWKTLRRLRKQDIFFFFCLILLKFEQIWVTKNNVSKKSRQNCKLLYPDSTVGSSLIWVYTVCQDLSVQKVRNYLIPRGCTYQGSKFLAYPTGIAMTLAGASKSRLSQEDERRLVQNFWHQFSSYLIILHQFWCHLTQCR